MWLQAGSLAQVCAHLAGQEMLSRPPAASQSSQPAYADLADVKGQAAAKRALEVAAAGAHSVLMSGPPGTGKSLLASCFPGILPPMSEAEALASAAVLSLNGGFKSILRQRPFRSRTTPLPPWHWWAEAAIHARAKFRWPITACCLDELPEFDRKVLEVLREPLETGQITISRAARQAEFPAQLPVHRRHEPLPLRLSRAPQWQVPLHPGSGCALSRKNFRAPARPHRYPDRSFPRCLKANSWQKIPPSPAQPYANASPAPARAN